MDTDSIEPARRKILIVAENRRGHGSGHLHRCARLARELTGDIEWLLPVHGERDVYHRNEVFEIIGTDDLPVRWIDTPDTYYDVVIVDRRTTTLQDLTEYNCRGIVIGIDMAGEARDYVHYAIDTLEPPPGTHRANICDTGLLHLPGHVREEWPASVRSVLVVFGGEGSGDHAVSRAQQLADLGEWSVTVVAPGASGIPEDIEVLTSRGNLAEELHRFDAVVTHFGLTAYEATWARVPVVLLNPSAYHERLSRNAGFVTVRTVTEVAKRLLDLPATIRAGRRIRPPGSSSLAHLIDDLSIPERSISPVTGNRFLPVVERFGERSFFTETETDLLFMQRFRPLSVTYDHDYFFANYQKQYGKTYLEDFPHIKAMGERRVSQILRHLSRGSTSSKPRLLDVGCAYGPFLQAASEAGIDPTGVDVSRDAVTYIQRELGFSAHVGDIRTIGNAEVAGPFDIVTMWFVIEHFSDLDTVMERISGLVRPGGIFAFSTPNGRGISGRRDKREFLRRSPEDHYTIMDKRSAARVLSRFGFSMVQFHATGHHPERFGIPLGKGGALGRGFRYRFLHGLSRAGDLGDTFEAIAEKRP
jgi:2-polyprenyl-3-methyl-5-hydroxy-6-metoxy-1,4-benzoquinol methylase